MLPIFSRLDPIKIVLHTIPLYYLKPSGNFHQRKLDLFNLSACCTLVAQVICCFMATAMQNALVGLWKENTYADHINNNK